MIANGRETALIPFMLRPFRCTDTRGRQARPRQYGYACVWGMGDLSPHAHKWSPIISVGRTPHITLSVWLCMWEREDQNASSVNIPPPRSRGGLWGISLLDKVDLNLLMKFTFFQSMCISWYFCIYTNDRTLWKPLHLYLSEGGTYHWIEECLFKIFFLLCCRQRSWMVAQKY